MQANVAYPLSTIGRVPGLAPWLACFGRSKSENSELRRDEIVLRSSSGSNAKALRLVRDADQPFPLFASDASCTVIFDGILWNRESLIDDLDTVFDANDAELILQMYQHRGEEVFQILEGVYVLILWDRNQNQLVCCRDKVGSIPLFYAQLKEEVFISPCLQSITDHSRVLSAINRLAICEFLCNRWPKPDETFYEHIRRVPAAHFLRWKDGNSQLTAYWDPLPDSERGHWVDQEMVKFDRLFEQSVERCMSIGQCGIFLSGGLDSVTVASLAADVAARQKTPPPLALSLLFPDPECNEENTQRSVARQLQIPQILLDFKKVYGSKGLLSTAVDLSRSWPVPTLAPWKSGYLHLARQAYEHECSVILTGSGGDEWLTVNPLHSADLIKSFNLPALAILMRNLLRSYSLPPLPFLRYILWNCGVKPLLRAYAPAVIPNKIRRRRMTSLKKLTPSWIAVDPQLRKAVEQRLEETVENSIRKPLPRGKYPFYYDNFRDIYQRSLASMEIEENFEAGRRAGILFLRPFCDPKVIELLLRVRPMSLHYGGREKGMVRKLLSRRFPELRFESQKKVIALGFLKDILINESPALWQRMNGTQALIELGIVDKRSLPTVFDTSLAGNIEQNYRIWKLLSVEAWVGSRV